MTALVARSNAMPPSAIAPEQAPAPEPERARPRPSPRLCLFPKPEPSMSSSSLQLPCTLDAMRRVRQGLEPGLGDRLAAFLASTVSPCVDPTQGGLDLVERLLFVLDQTEGELLVVVLGPHVGHVERDVGEVARRLRLGSSQGLIGHLVEVPAEPARRLRRVFLYDSTSSFFSAVGMKATLSPDLVSSMLLLSRWTGAGEGKVAAC